jgi:hypothetical protein
MAPRRQVNGGLRGTRQTYQPSTRLSQRRSPMAERGRGHREGRDVVIEGWPQMAANRAQSARVPA